MKNIYTISIILLIILFFTFLGCPADPAKPESPDIDVLARVVGQDVVLTWDTVKDVSAFTVYRKQGTGSFDELAVVETPGSTYTDTACPVEVELCYKIEFVLQDNPVINSNESNTVVVSVPDDYMTNKVTASRLQYRNQIRIYWNDVNGVDSYKVYRYESTEFADPEIFDAATNKYLDESSAERGPVAGVPYFYRVACVAGGITYVESSMYPVGIFHTEIDHFENNDTPENAAEIPGGEQTAYIYSFQDGDAQDTDWYTSPGTGSPRDIQITVTLPDDSQLNGEIRLVFDSIEIPNVVLAEGTNSIGFGVTETLNFRIEFIYFDVYLDVLDSYNIQINIY